MEYGLIGEKLGHSFSREIHARIAPYTYELKEMPLCDVAPFLASRKFNGINVTIPYKTVVIPHLDYIDEQARAIGAVNTVVNRDGKLYGYNTDYRGMAYLLSSAGIDVKNKKALILGTGGTSLTAQALLNDLGAKPVLRVSRTAQAGAVDYESVYREHTDAQIIINTTPVGMYPACDGMPIDLAQFPHLSGVADAVYHPLRTPLILSAMARGIPASGGLPMLVAQAVCAAELFLDKEFRKNDMARIVRDVTREKEHLILIGMPASGKSSVGKVLAQKLNRPCIDLDEEIVKTAGMDIPTIFREKGEDWFRNLESEELRRVAFSHTGAIICTGGGSPLREENRIVMHQTGRVYWIDRSLESLTPTADRPTASTKEAIEQRYRERYPIYRSAADCRIDGEGDIATVATRIYEEF